jgi:hypothetical protein
MHKPSSKKLDLSQLAKAVVDEATGEASVLAGRSAKKKSGSVKAGRKGGSARMGALTAEERSELARRAAIMRWGGQAPAKKAGAVRVKGSSAK